MMKKSVAIQMLTNLQTARSFFQSPIDDASLTLLLEVASSTIENLCGREFIEQVKNDILTGLGGRTVKIKL